MNTDAYPVLFFVFCFGFSWFFLVFLPTIMVLSRILLHSLQVTGKNIGLSMITNWKLQQQFVVLWIVKQAQDSSLLLVSQPICSSYGISTWLLKLCLFSLVILNGALSVLSTIDFQRHSSENKRESVGFSSSVPPVLGKWYFTSSFCKMFCLIREMTRNILLHERLFS